MYYGDFATVMQAAKTDAERLQVQMIYTLANTYRTKLIRKIDATFGHANKHLPVAARRRGASGALRNSVTLYAIDRGFAVSVGNQQVPYARIHEYGGVITPKNVNWLTIPAHVKTYGYRARMFPLYFVPHGNNKASLRFANKTKLAKKGDVAFWLVKSVKIREKAYIRGTLHEFQNAEALQIINRFKHFFGDTTIVFEV